MALLESSGHSLSQTSWEFAIEQSVLRAWRRKSRPAGTRPVVPAGNGGSAAAAPLTADQAEVCRLRRELERVQTNGTS